MLTGVVMNVGSDCMDCTYLAEHCVNGNEFSGSIKDGEFVTAV
jgi:hypothetical protein